MTVGGVPRGRKVPMLHPLEAEPVPHWYSYVSTTVSPSDMIWLSTHTPANLPRWTEVQDVIAAKSSADHAFVHSGTDALLATIVNKFSAHVDS